MTNQTDPIFKREDIYEGYWSTTGDWDNVHGPFETYEDAERAYNAYINYLEHGIL